MHFNLDFLRSGPARSAPCAAQARVVLVVDDDDLVRETLVEFLERAGHAAVAAQDGAEALWVLEHECVDLVITDLGMPLVNGFELARRVRERWPALPVIIMSGDPAELERVAALGVPQPPCLEKPFSYSALGHTMQQLLGGAPLTSSERQKASA